MTGDSTEEQAKEAVRSHYSALFVYGQANGDRSVRITAFDSVAEHVYNYEITERGGETTEQTYTGTVLKEGGEWRVKPDHDSPATSDD